ncbi:MAG TPA: hypothetical protein VGV67_00445 [Solirubrobacteraceae bacterium]|nr:hypothetical protein [Solirubrobacteraceae bacterium]
MRLSAIAAAAIALLPASAQAVPCEEVAPYPGDAAAPAAIAQWMAYGASLAGLPRELPVMGALVESGLRNLPRGDDDRAGYFQMRVSIWNSGAYAGFPANPPLQLKWFVDRTAAERAARIDAGQPDPAAAENAWGDWIADVLAPPENARHLYQQRLAEARALIGPPCTATVPPPPPPPAPPPPPPPPAADITAPVVRVSGAGSQRALSRGSFVLIVRCLAEPCTTSATAAVALPGTRRAARIALKARAMAPGETRRLRFVLSRSVRERLRAALRTRRSVKATVRITVRDAAGNRLVRTRTVRLTR